MNITTKPFEYMDGKTKCIGYIAWDESYHDPKPCVMVGHAWGGLDNFAENKAIQMAAQGYVGFAIDVYGNGQRGETQSENQALMTPFIQDRKMLLKRLKAAYKAAQNLDQVDENAVAMMGFCFGGLCTLDLARSGLDLAVAISFHGLFGANDLPPKKIKASVLALHGWDDPMVPPNDVSALGMELTKAKCDWQIHAYGGTSHAFMVEDANDPKNGVKYNARAERRAWTAALDLLSEKFTHHGVG
ncbi:MAG: dienelactone hydrolase family protein [Robiginitomaculum sp.]|nr:dienelactone hydrolase family protein [Robiginitomaculum sp.]